MSVVEVPVDGDYHKGDHDQSHPKPQAHQHGEYIYSKGFVQEPLVPNDPNVHLQSQVLPDVTEAVRGSFPEGWLVQEVVIPRYNQKALTEPLATRILTTSLSRICQKLLELDEWPKKHQLPLYDRLFKGTSNGRRSLEVNGILYKYTRQTAEPVPLRLLITDIGYPQDSEGKPLATKMIYWQLGKGDPTEGFTTTSMGRFTTSGFLEVRSRRMWALNFLETVIYTPPYVEQLIPMPQRLGLPATLLDPRIQPLSTIAQDSDWTSNNTVL